MTRFGGYLLIGGGGLRHGGWRGRRKKKGEANVKTGEVQYQDYD